MNKTIIDLIFKLFGNTIKTRLNSWVVVAILWGFAQVMKLSPTLAAQIHPDAIATFLTTFILTDLNVITNSQYINKNTELKTVVVDLQNTLKDDKVVIPVEKATPVSNSDTVIPVDNNLKHLH